MTLKYILALSLALILSLSALSPAVGAEEQPTEEQTESADPYKNLTYEQWQSYSYSEKLWIISHETYATCEEAVHWTYSKTYEKLDEYSYSFYEFVKDPDGKLIELLGLFPSDDPPYTVDPQELQEWITEHHGGVGYAGGTHGGGGGGGVRPDRADVSQYEQEERQNEYYTALLGFHTGESEIDLGNGFVFKEMHRVIDVSTGDTTDDSSDTPKTIRIEKGLDIYFNGNWVETKWFSVSLELYSTLAKWT